MLYDRSNNLFLVLQFLLKNSLFLKIYLYKVLSYFTVYTIVYSYIVSAIISFIYSISIFK